MAEAQTHISQTLAEQYLLKEKDEKPDMGTKPVEVKEVDNPVNAASEEVASGNAEAAAEKNTDVIPDATEEKISGVNPIVSAGESTEASSEPPPPPPAAAGAAEESNETTEENLGDQEVAEETPEIKIETAPADIRFPTTNQTRHCFTRYIEYHRCIAAKGDGAPECDKFAKYYRSICPGEWIDNWNEQRENGTFPGPL